MTARSTGMGALSTGIADGSTLGSGGMSTPQGREQPWSDAAPEHGQVLVVTDNPIARAVVQIADVVGRTTTLLPDEDVDQRPVDWLAEHPLGVRDALDLCDHDTPGMEEQLRAGLAGEAGDQAGEGGPGGRGGLRGDDGQPPTRGAGLRVAGGGPAARDAGPAPRAGGPGHRRQGARGDRAVGGGGDRGVLLRTGRWADAALRPLSPARPRAPRWPPARPGSPLRRTTLPRPPTSPPASRRTTRTTRTTRSRPTTGSCCPTPVRSSGRPPRVSRRRRR